VQLRGSGDQIALLDGAGQVVIEGSQEEVMRAQLGWSMPLAVFPAWLRGEPKSGLPAADLQRDAAGLVRSFRQLDWLISYEQYRAVETASEMRTLPRKLSATNGATRVRIVISEWRI
jgi:outer membrane biogenesis lipoprotein LolB